MHWPFSERDAESAHPATRAGGGACQEQPSMAKADSVLKATLADGTQRAFILEFLTRWDEEKLLDPAQYTIFCKKKLRLKTGAVLILFTPHSAARSIYEDESITFRFRLLKLYEIDAG